MATEVCFLVLSTILVFSPVLKAKVLIALAECHVTCRKGSETTTFGIPDPKLPIHYITFTGMIMMMIRV